MLDSIVAFVKEVVVHVRKLLAIPLKLAALILAKVIAIVDVA